jgi:pimeloyl-ACP methyl ester carboxylesterase
MSIQYAELSVEGRPLRLEYAWLNAERRDAPVILFLHEALGALAMWRDFPQRLCDAAGFRGLVYSRYGHGGSTARPPREPWPLDYLEREARVLLPEFLRAVGGDARPWLFGHSDGASIALIYAGAGLAPTPVALLLEAPHVVVEDLTVTGIAQIHSSYGSSNLRERLERHHGTNVDALFEYWTRVWLSAEFRSWNIEEHLPRVTCPTLVIQGRDDEYGTLRQMDAIAGGVSRKIETVILDDCRHSPHIDQRDAVEALAVTFLSRLHL